MLTARCLLVAILVTATSVAFAQAQPESDKSKKAPAKLVPKTYSVAELIDEGMEPLLIDFVTHAIKPQGWKGQGGRGTIEYAPATKSLVVNQTPEGHKQVTCLLQSLKRLQAEANHRSAPLPTADCRWLRTGGANFGVDGKVEQASCCAPPPPPPVCLGPGCCTKTGACCSGPSCPPSKASTPCKQYGHFVLDNVTINAMGVSAKIKRVRFMYKGDGIDGDVAKCALTDGESEKTVDKGKLDTLLEKLGELLEKKTSTGMTPQCVGGLLGAAAGAGMSTMTAPAPCALPPCSEPIPVCPSSCTSTMGTGCWVPAPRATTSAPAPVKVTPVENDPEDD